jgi:5'-AMP-activated protein kinase regulatory beta subunit
MGQGTSNEQQLDEHDDYEPTKLKDEVLQMVAGDQYNNQSDSKEESSLVNTTFVWKHGGKEVFLTGSFNQWLGKIPMKRTSTGEFTLSIDVPTGRHHYKFIVDDKWRFSPDQETEIDGEGRINNVLEVGKNKNNRVSVSEVEEEGEESYGQLIPGIEEYSVEAQMLPSQLCSSALNSVGFDPDSSVLPMLSSASLCHTHFGHGGGGVVAVGTSVRYGTKRCSLVYYVGCSGAR